VTYEGKRKVYEGLVLAILFYSSECWCLRESELQELHSFHQETGSSSSVAWSESAGRGATSALLNLRRSHHVRELVVVVVVDPVWLLRPVAQIRVLQALFDMDFPQKVFCGVFELPLLRNAQKKKGTYLPHLVAICQMYVGFQKKNFGAP
jgi:hypothetical protein